MHSSIVILERIKISRSILSKEEQRSELVAFLETTYSHLHDKETFLDWLSSIDPILHKPWFYGHLNMEEEKDLKTKLLSSKSHNEDWCFFCYLSTKHPSSIVCFTRIEYNNGIDAEYRRDDLKYILERNEKKGFIC